MTRVLVIGLSGQVGEALLPRLLGRGVPVLALSRQPRADVPGLHWLAGSLQAPPQIPADVDTVLGVGPLDAFADWLDAGGAPGARRVVALGSTGRLDKVDSPDPAERALAARLGQAEARLFAAGRRRQLAVTLLRPTLLYGAGRDQTVSRLVASARRWRVLPLPASATGLRQPVHVADVAEAVVRCLDTPATAGRAYDLPGGERLPFVEMARRAVRRLAPGSRVVVLPAWCFRLGLQLVARWRGQPAEHLGALARLSSDQLVDSSAAERDFGYAPRDFDP